MRCRCFDGPPGHRVHRALREDFGRKPGRLQDAWRKGRGPLRRKGAKSPGARAELREPHRTQHAHCPHGGGHDIDDVLDHADRNRGIAAGAEPDQAAQAPFQRPAEGRQELSEHSRFAKVELSADQEASRGEEGGRELLRPLRIRRRCESHAESAPENFPASELLGIDVPEPHEAVLAVSNKALLRALRRLHRRNGVRRTRR